MESDAESHVSKNWRSCSSARESQLLTAYVTWDPHPDVEVTRNSSLVRVYASTFRVTLSDGAKTDDKTKSLITVRN